MNGGDPILGGGQANPNPGNTQPTPPGSQPAPSATPTTTPSQAPTPMPQVPQSPVNTAPTPANTTQSPDSFSSFSTQPSRPIAPPHMPTYGNSFSRPTVGHPSFPAPNPIDQPINPIAPNGIINGSQMPSSTFPSSDQVVFSDTGATSATSSGKGKKIAIIILLLFLVAGGVVAALFATGVLGGSKSTSNAPESSNTPSTKEEIYDTLQSFDLAYTSLIDTYNNSIGLTPSFNMTENNTLFPIESIAEPMFRMSESVMNSYNKNILVLPDKLDNNIDITSAKNAIGNSLQALERNVNLIQQFYDIYISPLSGNSRPVTCSETKDMTDLNKGDTAEAAQKYYTLYCSAINFLNTHNGNLYDSDTAELYRQAVIVSASEAANALNKLLVEVPSATGDINKLLEELLK